MLPSHSFMMENIFVSLSAHEACFLYLKTPCAFDKFQKTRLKPMHSQRFKVLRIKASSESHHVILCKISGRRPFLFRSVLYVFSSVVSLWKSCHVHNRLEFQSRSWPLWRDSLPNACWIAVLASICIYKPISQHETPFYSPRWPLISRPQLIKGYLATKQIKIDPIQKPSGHWESSCCDTKRQTGDGRWLEGFSCRNQWDE